MQHIEELTYLCALGPSRSGRGLLPSGVSASLQSRRRSRVAVGLGARVGGEGRGVERAPFQRIPCVSFGLTLGSKLLGAGPIVLSALAPSRHPASFGT